MRGISSLSGSAAQPSAASPSNHAPSCTCSLEPGTGLPSITNHSCFRG
jgi:hypothetical protein